MGVDYFARAGLALDAAPPRGLIDRVEALADTGADLGALPHEVRAFFEDPASLELRVRSRWRPVFRGLWRVMRGVMRAVGQLHLPLDEAVVRARMVALDGAREGRSDARGVVRTWADTGEVFQVFAYGVASVAGAARMSVAIPWPGGHLAGLLRLTVEEATATLTTRPRHANDGVGVWFVAPRWSLRLPLEETLRFWRVDDPAAPLDRGDRAWPRATFVARHEQRLFGALVVEHFYAFRPC